MDRQSGLINKVAITPANVTDAQGMQPVCPESGAVYADKGYCGKRANQAAVNKGVHLTCIKRSHMKSQE